MRKKECMTQLEFSKELENWCAFSDAIVSTFKEESSIYNTEEVHNCHDKGYKYLLSIKRYFIDFVKLFMKINLYEDITEECITLLDKEFITVDFEKRESDLIYEVKSNGKKAYFILLEIQSRVDRKMAYRILNYMVEIWRKCESNRGEGEIFGLAPIIPCVLYTGKNRWSSPIEFKDLYTNVNGIEEYLVNFKYILIDIFRYKPEDLLKMSNIIGSAFYLDTSTRKNMEKRLMNLTESLKNADKKEIESFKRWMINVFVIDEGKRKIIEEKFVKEEEDMGNLAKIAMSYYTDGVEAGREEGREEGKAEGKEEGRIEERKAMIKRVLSYKLGSEENDKVIMLVDKATTEKLDRIEQKLFEIDSWEEVEKIINGMN